ncbi:MAG: glycosyltransferase family 39 protein [bacterium]
MKNKILIFLLILFSIVSFVFNTYRQNVAPPCFNADEAAFGYNSYSIMQTGKDEYGNFMPLRLKSFNDYKLPLYSYLSIPFIKIMGLNQTSTRALNDLVSIFIPIAVFFFVKELFNNKFIALISSLLTATSLGLHIIGRQAHEAYLAALFIIISSIFFVRSLKKISALNSIFFITPLALALFTYQSSRIFAAFFLIFSIFYFFVDANKQKLSKSIFVFLIIVVVALFSFTDIKYSPTRLKNLFLFTNPGLQIKTQELRAEEGSRLLYNKLTVGSREAFFNHLEYFSPQFLAISGDENIRFGYGEMYPITPLEYFFIFVGLYYLIKNKEKWRWFILSLLFITPISASLSWADTSLTRSLFLIIPILSIASYGFCFLYKAFPQKQKIILISVIVVEFVFLLYSWSFYLNHYPKRGIVTNSMQCGYKELASYVNENYDKFDNFYISPELGMPYIFLLFYNKYPPSEYQKQANLTPPDQYGFGQVEKFDKFIFSLTGSENKKNVSLIAFPHDFNYLNSEDLSKIKKIKKMNNDIFWIHEVLN